MKVFKTGTQPSNYEISQIVAELTREFSKLKDEVDSLRKRVYRSTIDIEEED